MTSYRLIAPKLYDINAYVDSLSRLESWSRAGFRELVLDFRSTERAYPDGMLPLVATLRRMREQHAFKVRLLEPTHEVLRGVFNGVGWSKYLTASEVQFDDLPRQTRRFTPVRPFRDAGELAVLHKSITDVLVTQARLATWLPEAIEWALWEVMENVLNHAMTSYGWVQVSTFPGKRHANIVVADTGIGIRESLAELDPRFSDREAIRQAVEKGVTRNIQVGAGYGLAGCRQIVRLNRGRMIVYSGSAELIQELKVTGWGAGRKEEELLRYRPVPTAHQGTIVELELRTDNPIDLREALGHRRILSSLETTRTSGEEFVFRIVDEAGNLGTREAGRSLRTKVLNLSQTEDQERIVLDFGGVEMLSSSFADEFVAKLAHEVGKTSFFRRFELRHMNSSVDTIVQITLWDRLG